jgi:hypothetical protein
MPTRSSPNCATKDALSSLCRFGSTALGFDCSPLLRMSLSHAFGIASLNN